MGGMCPVCACELQCDIVDVESIDGLVVERRDFGVMLTELILGWCLNGSEYCTTALRIQHNSVLWLLISLDQIKTGPSTGSFWLLFSVGVCGCEHTGRNIWYAEE